MKSSKCVVFAALGLLCLFSGAQGQPSHEGGSFFEPTQAHLAIAADGIRMERAVRIMDAKQADIHARRILVQLIAEARQRLRRSPDSVERLLELHGQEIRAWAGEDPYPSRGNGWHAVRPTGPSRR